MTDHFDFDQTINREGSHSLKYDLRKLLFGDANVTPMWVADMDFAPPPAVTGALIERAKHPILGYTLEPDSLFDALIQWHKKRHGWDIKREWILLSPGVVPSLHAASLAFAQAGESIIVQPPVYFPFFAAVKNTGRTLIENPLLLQNNRYSIDFDHLESCAEKARMLFLCSPHNPVGRVWRTDELQRLLSIAEQHDLMIFSDEIHADLIYPDNKHYPLATLANGSNNIITAVAPSKTFNIAGLGLSALIVPDATHRLAIQQAFETLHTSASNPFSMVAFEAAYSEGENWLEALLSYLTTTRDFVTDYLATHLPQIKLIAPESTYLLWLDCRSLGMNDHELKKFFIEKAQLGLSHGTLFGTGGSGFMRMNIGAPKQTIADALEQLKQALISK